MNEIQRLLRAAWTRNPKENWERARRKFSGKKNQSDLRLATVNEWWQLTRNYPLMRRSSHTPLKDYGYLAVLEYIDRVHPQRVLEFGHGLSHGSMDQLYTRTDIELWACDDNIGNPYYFHGDRQQWQIRYDALKLKYQNVHFVQALLGDPAQVQGNIPNDYFDLVISVSVLEELSLTAFESVIRHSFDLMVPGGKLLCSFDVKVGDIATIAARIESIRKCGFVWSVDESALSFISWNDVLLEEQFIIMVSYQWKDGENRRFRGNYTTLMIEAVKPSPPKSP